MRKCVALGAVAALGLAGQAVAADGFSYNLIEASYIKADLDDLNVKGDGFGLSGSAQFSEHVFGFANYTDVDYDANVSGRETSFGLGFNWPLSPAVDLISGLSYESFKVDVSGLGNVADDDGYGLTVGVRGRAGERLELTGSVKYMDFGGGADDTKLTAGGRYYFSDAFAAGIDVTDQKGITSWLIAVRYDFGNRR